MFSIQFSDFTYYRSGGTAYNCSGGTPTAVAGLPKRFALKRGGRYAGLRRYGYRRYGVAIVAALALLCLMAMPARAQEGDLVYLPLVRLDGAMVTVTSPSRSNLARVYLTDARGGTGAVRFDVSRVAGAVETPVVAAGRLGLELKGSATASFDDSNALATLLTGSSNFKWLGSTVRSVRTSYNMPIAERSTIPDRYDEATITLQGITSGVQLQIIVRAYNEGIAIRYRIPQQTGVAAAQIDGEVTTFAFAGDLPMWAQASDGGHPHENEHLPTTLSAIATASVENPVTLKANDSLYLALTEAAVENYPASRLARAAGRALRFELRGTATGALPFVTPWRVLMMAESPGKLVEQNYLMYNLAPPSRVADTSWLKPGKAMRVMNVSNADFAISVVEFAAARGIDYIEFDAGWYGNEFNPAVSLLVPLMGEFEFERVRQRADQLGIGIVLYVNFVQLQRDVDNIMGRYKSWGVDGLKLGFVDGLTQAGIKEVLYTVQKAAQYEMFVDIHDNYCPSGMGRTWPNLFTQECVRGNEHYPGAEHNATLPFTRMLLGPADYTIAWYSNLKNVTRAHQMALSVLYYSPLKFLFWYDVPSSYSGESEVEFFRHLPATWDETRMLVADVSNVASVARRSGDEWFVGSITDGTARTIELPLDFLTADTTYTAHLFADGGGTVVNGSQQSVTSADTLTINLPASGGNAIWIEPTP